MPDRFVAVFPGQGSQYVGMGKDLWENSPAARRILAAADDILGFDLIRLCFEGPEAELRATNNAQPAILAVSVAAWAASAEAVSLEIRPAYTAGHSLGEFSALIVAGALSYEDGLRLVRRRGDLMSVAGEARPGAMAAILGLAEVDVDAACREAAPAGIVVVANYNSEGQTVISGEPEAVARAGEIAKGKGARRVVPLSVSGAFHSPLMQPAAAEFRRTLAEANLRDPLVPVIGNVKAEPLRTASEVRADLSAQIESPVQWTRTMLLVTQEGIGTLVEVGPGQVLSGLVKRNRNLSAVNVDSAASARALADKWSVAS
ncbi:MAG: ACP S-malonyltransferase [Chloroflexota bacterium]